MTVMMAAERAVIAAWQLFGGDSTIERFKSKLERQAHPEWNKAVRVIADAIRNAEMEARAYADSIIEGWREREFSMGEDARWAIRDAQMEADLAKERDAERSVEPDPEPSFGPEVLEVAEVEEWQR